MAERAAVKRVKETYKEAIMSKPNVIGVGTGYKESMGANRRTMHYHNGSQKDAFGRPVPTGGCTNRWMAS
jgi:hypothetical protein